MKNEKKNGKKVNVSRDAAEYQNEKYRETGSPNSIAGINSPGIELPAFNPPVPNRAWTEMRKGMALDNTMSNALNGELVGEAAEIAESEGTSKTDV